jgi:hypothetical protein
VHTSGVTRRASEISKYKDFESIEIDDFRSSTSRTSLKTGISVFWLKKFIRVTAIRFGFLSESNTTKDLHSIKPWVLALRGHYNEIQFEDESLRKLYELFKPRIQGDNLASCSLGIHYRLGDLVTLESKGPVFPELIAQQIDSLLGSNSIDIKIYSDSGELALNLLSPLVDGNIKIKIVEATAEQTISMLIEERFFVGTSSKISVWVAVFRALILGKNGTYMPKSFEKELRAHGANSLINYY